jgi:hypothetical protein
MPEISRDQIASPNDFLGNFSEYVKQVQKDLEAIFGDDPGPFATVAEHAEARAPSIAAQSWLVERWGEHYPCPVCRNVEWTVTEVARSEISAGFLAFYVICGYCGNAMRCVPGYADLEVPRVLDEQLQFPAPER